MLTTHGMNEGAAVAHRDDRLLEVLLDEDANVMDSFLAALVSRRGGNQLATHAGGVGTTSVDEASLCAELVAGAVARRDQELTFHEALEATMAAMAMSMPQGGSTAGADADSSEGGEGGAAAVRCESLEDLRMLVRRLLSTGGHLASSMASAPVRNDDWMSTCLEAHASPLADPDAVLGAVEVSTRPVEDVDADADADALVVRPLTLPALWGLCQTERVKLLDGTTNLNLHQDTVQERHLSYGNAAFLLALPTTIALLHRSSDAWTSFATTGSTTDMRRPSTTSKAGVPSTCLFENHGLTWFASAMGNDPRILALMEPVMSLFVLPLLKKISFHFSPPLTQHRDHGRVDMDANSGDGEGPNHPNTDPLDACEAENAPIDTNPPSAGAPSQQAKGHTFSVHLPEYFFSYVLALQRDVLPEMIRNAVTPQIDEILATLATSPTPGSGVCEKMAPLTRDDIEVELMAPLEDIVALLLWSQALHYHFCHAYAWSTANTAAWHMPGEARRLMHTCNCMFDLARSLETTAAGPRGGSGGCARAIRSVVVDALLVGAPRLGGLGGEDTTSLQHASSSPVIAVWCDMHVGQLLAVCEDEAVRPTLWRRAFLITPTDEQNFGCTPHDSEEADGGDISPVILKMLRGLRAAVDMVSRLLRDTPQQAMFGRQIWALLVCKAISEFVGTFDVRRGNNTQRLQTMVGDQLDAMLISLVGCSNSGAVPHDTTVDVLVSKLCGGGGP